MAITINVEALLEKRLLPDLVEARAEMVRYLSGKGFSESVLEAMGVVPRHAFAPPHLWRMAYADIDLWGPTAFLPAPHIVANLLTELELNNQKSILEYATGTGYLTILLALLSARSYTVEHNPWLLWLSADAFRELGITNISQKASDGRLGWPEKAPFDAIVICASMPAIPTTLLSQLSEGGVLIVPVGPFTGPCQLRKVKKMSGGMVITDLGQCYFPPLTGAWPNNFQNIHGGEADVAPATADTEGFWNVKDNWSWADLLGRVEGNV